jgi:hypothetical protein
MNAATLRPRIRRSLAALASVLSLCTVLSGEAQATCVTTAKGQRLATIRQVAALNARIADVPAGPVGSLVGLWNSEFFLGQGPELFDHTFQHFHSDRSEMMLSRGLPPSLGNVCVGIWKQTAPRSFVLRHMAWNWDAEGRFISIFMMDVRISLDRHGNTYTGAWTSDNLDPSSGEPISGEHFEGIVRGTRIALPD